MSTVEINTWFAATFGVDPARFASPVGAKPADAVTAANRSVDPGAEPNQSIETDEAWLDTSIDPGLTDPQPERRSDKGVIKTSVPVGAKRLQIEVPAFDVLDGCFKAKFGCFIGVSGAAETIVPEAAETTTLVPISYDEGKLVAKVTSTWVNEEGVQVFGWPTVFSELEFEGAMEIKDGIEIKASASGTFGCGVKVKFEAMLFSYDTKSEMKLLELGFDAGFPVIPLDVKILDMPPVAEVHLKLEPTVSLALAPNWPRIWARVAEEVGKDVALGARAQAALRTALGGVNADIAIASGFLAIGAVAVAASVSAIEVMGDAAETPEQCAKLTHALLAAYKSGILGQASPALEMARPSYYEGVKARNEAIAKLKARFPEITEPQVQEVLDTVAVRLVEEARPKIEPAVKVKVWQSFARDHQDSWWSGSQKNRRENAWNNIFGDYPKGTEDLWRYPLGKPAVAPG